MNNEEDEESESDECSSTDSTSSTNDDGSDDEEVHADAHIGSEASNARIVTPDPTASPALGSTVDTTYDPQQHTVSHDAPHGEHQAIEDKVAQADSDAPSQEADAGEADTGDNDHHIVAEQTDEQDEQADAVP